MLIPVVLNSKIPFILEIHCSRQSSLFEGAEGPCDCGGRRRAAHLRHTVPCVGRLVHSVFVGAFWLNLDLRSPLMGG